MLRVPCPEPDCNFQTAEAGDVVAAVLLKHHLDMTHRVGGIDGGRNTHVKIKMPAVCLNFR